MGTQLVRSLSRMIPGCHIRQRLHQTEKCAVLTFEDGPDPASTPQLLDLLDDFQISATFFLVGEKVAEYPELAREIVQRGHTLGNHTYQHLDAWKATTLSLVKDIKSCSDVIDHITGQRPMLWRPPYGHATGKLVKWCQRQNIHTVLWDVAAADFSPLATVRSVEKTIINKVQPGSILSLHDNPQAARVTPAALKNALPQLLDDDWQFVPFDFIAA
ncbi:MAG: polysaccharide deacetylase family protein [Planctomycetaceae bacterium]|nr:polysaccharide deacetylase family protein [Planctomycetaceae bacterium]